MKSRVLGGVAGILFFFAACIGTAGPAFDVKGPTRYSVILLGKPMGVYNRGEHYMLPSAINNRGDIIGYSAQGPFLYRHGVVRVLWSEDEPFYAYNLPAI